jgi:hypothetical protein
MVTSGEKPAPSTVEDMAAPIETLAAGLQVMLRRRFPVQT